jgi:hypothetical protein
LRNNELCRVRLNRALALGEWCAMFPDAKVMHLTVVKCDHSLIILINEMEASNPRITIPKPFRYEVMWERHEGYKEVLDNVRSERKADSVVDLSDKLRSTSSAFAKWGSTSFGAVQQQLRQNRKKLAILTAEPQRVGPSSEERNVEG